MRDNSQKGSQSAGPHGVRADPGLLAKILETCPIGIAVVDAGGQITFANRKAEAILGLSGSEITGRAYNAPEWRTTTFEGGPFPDEELPFQKVRDTGKAVENVRHALVWPDGRTVCLSTNASPLTGADGGFAGMIATIVDVTEAVETERVLRRQNRANQVLSRCNEALIRASDEASLLKEICRIVVEDGGYRLAWVGYAEEAGGKIVRPVAQCGFEEGYLDQVNITWDETDTGRGPTGTAIRTGQPARASNILSNPAFAPWREQALKRGYASSLALPLIVNSHTLGALNIYASEPDAFDSGEERLLMQMADDLAYGITALRVREERTRTLMELKESREDWRRIFNSISDPVMILDLDQSILIANPATAKKLKLPLDLIIGHKCYKLFHKLDEPPESCPFKCLVESGSAETGEMEMEAVIGTFLVTVAPIFNAEGKLSRVLHIAKDITDRKQAEKKLHESETMYRAIFEATGTATLIIDTDRTIVMANRESLQVTGYSYDELIGTKWISYVAPESLETMLKYHQARREDASKAPEQYEAKLINKEGKMRDALLRVTMVPGTEQSIVSILDITDRKILEENLRQAQKLESVGRLAGGVAHDFNNYLTAIEGYIDLALRQLPPRGEAAVDLHEARSAADSAADLTRQLLLFSRRMPVAMEPIDLNDVIHDHSRMLSRLIGEQYEIRLELAESPMRTNADKTHVEQLVMNLVTNARDAMPGGGRITIKTRTETIAEPAAQLPQKATPGPYACLLVRDEGHGMDEETLGQIFEPFFTTKEAGKGTGLGLSVAHGIVAEHGGWIDVESAPGKGSTFKVCLPVAPQAAGEGISESVPPESLPQGNGERLLIVEDEDSIRSLAARMLEENGYRVTAAADAAAATEIFAGAAEKFDLVFSDVVMPGMNGLDLVTQLLGKRPDLKVILASGYANGVNTDQIHAADYSFLRKPYSMADLLRAVKATLEKK